VRDLTGRVAVVTGGGSGIGRGIAHVLADTGMRVVVADIEDPAAEAVASELGDRATAMHVDVADLVSVRALADRVEADLGPVDVLCNNAGVTVWGRLVDMKPTDWDWVLSVNLRGVVHGLLAFLPRMRDRRAGHVVNTASMGGLLAGPGLGVYCTTKYAVVAISEALRPEAAEYGVGVSVVCPGLVRTRLDTAGRNAPAGVPIDHAGLGPLGVALESGLDPIEVGRAVRRAIERNELYVLTSPEFREVVEHRFNEILAAF
jgi:NAD(P)-dependent dehydrogenase (short-subunit alcohol dehydrogenase family)